LKKHIYLKNKKINKEYLKMNSTEIQMNWNFNSCDKWDGYKKNTLNAKY
jgi:hypothetical protein